MDVTVLGIGLGERLITRDEILRVDKLKPGVTISVLHRASYNVGCSIPQSLDARIFLQPFE